MITAGNLITDISDQLPNFVINDFDLKKSKERPLVRVFNKKNIANFNQNIQNDILDINTCLNAIPISDVNERYSIFNKKLFDILEKYFPRVKLSRKKFNDKEWITDGIKRSIKHRNKLFHIQLHDPIQCNIDKWKTYRNKLNKIIRDTQKKFYQNEIRQHNNNCLGLWKTLGSIISKKN